ncbi:subtilisin, putative [Perkinsus marinus ATCC 50983]|uniref:subtilisin n=1 Tax=Perkinsus marinus (strain ATCC 50983 / TXsc) TaxID=423536 RepID=C5KLH3_PERM5|nr:subtilisin, putative [Perkinsus marinus ATCC 50983]EER14668.1 subtilisin, putative [Perkinsus marinus ATCC 50983]|eukprot:XP_002782872.1 subtilisin, putative [Perkinsus marinus ATCC 50983]
MAISEGSVLQKDYLEAISIPEAWSILDSTPKRTPVTIAVIDDGIEAAHPDLKGTVIKGYNVVDKNDDTSPRGRHGTCMAGIVGAIRNNKIGMAGILDSVRILPIFDGEVLSYSAIEDAFTYLINKRRDDVKVILMTEGMATWIWTRPHTFLVPSAVRPLMECYVWLERMQLTDESNFGSAVDIAAPGYDIVQTSLEGEYGWGSGTSAAAAIVAGIAGMLYSLEPSVETRLTPAYIKKIIKDTATKGVKDSKGKKTLSFGRVNAAAAVKKILGRKKV